MTFPRVGIYASLGNTALALLAIVTLRAPLAIQTPAPSATVTLDSCLVCLYARSSDQALARSIHHADPATFQRIYPQVLGHALNVRVFLRCRKAGPGEWIDFAVPDTLSYRVKFYALPQRRGGRAFEMDGWVRPDR